MPGETLYHRHGPSCPPADPAGGVTVPSPFGRGSKATDHSVELAPHHNGRVLCEAPLPRVGLVWPCAAQVLAGILFDQAPHLRCALSRRLGIGHPALDHLVQMTLGDMLKL